MFRGWVTAEGEASVATQKEIFAVGNSGGKEIG
jgi:hypothetical protein